MQINWDYYILNSKNLLCKLLPSESIFTNFWCRSLLCDCFNSTNFMDRSGSGIYNGSPTSARHCKLLLRLFLSKILKSLSSLNNSTCINMFPFSACYVKKDKFQYNAQLLQYPKILKYFCLSRLYCLLNVRAHKGLLQFLTFWMNVKYMDSSLRSFLYSSY